MSATNTNETPVTITREWVSKINEGLKARGLRIKENFTMNNETLTFDSMCLGVELETLEGKKSKQPLLLAILEPEPAIPATQPPPPGE
jgi:hypothetical protein